MHARHRLPAWPLILLLALLAGCSGRLLPHTEAPPAVYLLDAGEQQPARLVSGGPTLAISAVASAAGYDSADMLYVEHAHQLQAFARHRWADSPAHMLEPALLASAEHSGLFAAVSGPDSPARAQLRLDTQLLHLQQVFTADGSRVELALRASLVDTRSGKLIASQVIRVIEQAPQATPYGGVMAANRAAGLLMEEVQRFLRRAVARR